MATLATLFLGQPLDTLFGNWFAAVAEKPKKTGNARIRPKNMPARQAFPHRDADGCHHCTHGDFKSENCPDQD
jgi:hypothetical protein